MPIFPAILLFVYTRTCLMADVRAFAVFLRVYWKPCPCSLLNNWAELLWSKHFESRRSPPPWIFPRLGLVIASHFMIEICQAGYLVDVFPILYDLARTAGWEPYSLHDILIAHVFWAGSVLCRPCTTSQRQMN